MMPARPVCSIRLATVIGSKGKGVRENVKKTITITATVSLTYEIE